MLGAPAFYVRRSLGSFSAASRSVHEKPRRVSFNKIGRAGLRSQSDRSPARRWQRRESVQGADVGVASPLVSGRCDCVLAWQRDVCAARKPRDWWHEQLKENNSEMVPSQRVSRGCGRWDPVWKNVGGRRANGLRFGRVWFGFPFSGRPGAGIWGCVVSSAFGAVCGGFACGADWA